MPVGVPLSQLVQDLRNEVSNSTNTAHGVDDEQRLKYLITRTEQELFISNDWRTRRMRKQMTINEGQRFYNFPTELPFENINSIHGKNGVTWFFMEFEIKPVHYNVYDPERDQRSWPPRRWDINGETGQLEIWPIPNQNTDIMIIGQRAYTPMVDNDDVCSLDSLLIVMYAAVEILTRIDSTEAELKLNKARGHLQRLRGQEDGAKSNEVRLVPDKFETDGRYSRPFLDYIPS